MDDAVAMKAGRTTDPPESEDREVLTAVALGDPAALERLYTRHASTLLAVILRIVRVRADAEEVLQETFLEVWAHATRYDAQRSAVRSWLITIARTRAIDRIRRSGANARMVTTVTAVASPPEAAVVPQDALEQHQMDARVRSALQTLPPEQRGVLELAFLQGLTHREISEQTGIPLGTVKTRIRAAMQKLAGVL